MTPNRELGLPLKSLQSLQNRQRIGLRHDSDVTVCEDIVHNAL